MNYSENFSLNLKALRKERKLTQKELAQLLGYSDKTISKWECGASIPTIEILFDIAKILQVSIEDLFADSEIYYLGIDGGGTKTDLALADKDGNIIRTLKTGSSNPMDIGIEAAEAILKEAIYKICKDIRFSSIYVFAGIAGGTAGDAQQKLREFFSEFNFLDFLSDSDNRNVVAAGLGNDDGITVLLGTGICVYTQRDRKLRRIAGWGYLIDNGGSGYNLGRDALNAYFCAIDGSGAETALTEEIDKIYPGGEQKLMGYIYKHGKKAVASFAPAVFAAIEKDDETAKIILRRNMKEVAHIIETASREFDVEKIPVILKGGITNQACVIEYLKSSLENQERFDFKVLDCAPVNGAVMLAQQLNIERDENNA